MKKFLKGLSVGLSIVILCLFVYATSPSIGPRTWTSFAKIGSPITLPPTQFVNGGVASGTYRSGGDLLMEISGGMIHTYVPFYDASGDAYITSGTMPPLNYVPLADSGVYFNLNSGTYFETNSGTYFLAHSGEYFDSHSGEYFEANSGTYFNLYSGDYFDTNIVGYITGFTELDPDFNTHSGDYLTGFTELDPSWNSDSGNYVPYSGATTTLNLGVQALNASNVLFTNGGNGFYTIIGTGTQGYGSISDELLYIYGTHGNGRQLDLSLLTADRNIKIPNATGVLVTDNTLATYGYITGVDLAPYCLLSQTGNWNTAYGWGNHANAGYLTGASLSPYTYLVGFAIGTGTRAYPGSATNLVTESAVSAYLQAESLNLGSVMTTGAYIMTATGVIGQGSRQVVISGGNLSFQLYTGGAWVERGFFN